MADEKNKNKQVKLNRSEDTKPHIGGGSGQ